MRSFSPAAQPPPATESLLSIQQVSRLLDVPAPTLRSWERRYDVPVTHRSAGGHRRYTDGEVELLRRMRDAIGNGSRAFAAADLVKQHPSESPERLVEDFLAAVHRLAPREIEQVIDFSRTCLGLDRCVDEVLLPAMRQVGLEWQEGACDVAHEHLASEAARAWLTRVTPADEQRLHSAPVLLACGPRDRHTLGLEALGALLTNRGVDCRLLGARTPPTSLARAVRDVRPGAVVLVSHLPAARRDAVESLRGVLDGTAVFYAGAAFATRQSRVGVPGRHLGNRISGAAEVVMSSLPVAA